MTVGNKVWHISLVSIFLFFVTIIPFLFSGNLGFLDSIGLSATLALFSFCLLWPTTWHKVRTTSQHVEVLRFGKMIKAIPIAEIAKVKTNSRQQRIVLQMKSGERHSLPTLNGLHYSRLQKWLEFQVH